MMIRASDERLSMTNVGNYTVSVYALVFAEFVECELADSNHCAARFIRAFSWFLAFSQDGTSMHRSGQGPWPS